MKVKEFAEKLGLKPLTGCGEDNEIRGVYVGDLLSVVMGNCREGDAWITVQTHPNILTVADLNDAACIVIAGRAAAEQSLIDKAEDAGVSLLETELSVYDLAWRTHEVLK